MLDALIVGPGALGTLLAASLARAGARVGLLCRDARTAAALKRGGLKVGGGRRLRVAGSRLAVFHRAAALGPARVVFLCVKAGDARAAARAVRPLARDAAAVVAVQNGVAHLAPLRALFGGKAVFAAVWIGAYKEGDGAVVHAGGDAVALGGGAPEARKAASAALRRAGWRVEERGAAERVLWEKACFNAALNPLAALTGLPNGAIASDPPLAELLSRAAGEAEAVLRALGHRPPRRGLAERALGACRAAPGNVNSMLADVRAGRPSETPEILTPVVRAAKARRVPAPVLSALEGLMRRLDKEIRGAAARR